MSLDVVKVTEDYRSNPSCDVTIALESDVKVLFTFGKNDDDEIYYMNLEKKSNLSSWREKDIEALPKAKDKAKEEARARLL